MVESGKSKTSVAPAGHQISVSGGSDEANNANQEKVTFDDVLDDLKELDDFDRSPVSEEKSNATKSGAANPTSNATPKPTRPRPIRTTDGMVAGTVRRNNLAPITKRPLGVPMAKRVSPTVPTVQPDLEEQEERAPLNPLLTTFWTKPRLIIGGVVLVVLIAGGVTAAVLLNKNSNDNQEPAQEETITSTGLLIDYEQAATGPDGATLNTTHERGDEGDLVVIYPNLKCSDENCTNLSGVKIGSAALNRGTDYTATMKDNKLVFTLLANRLNLLKTGTYALIFDLTDGADSEKVSRIGLKFTITGEDDQDSEATDNEEKPTTPSESTTNRQPSSSSSNRRPTTGSSSSTNNSGSNNTGNSGNSGNTGGNTGSSGDTGNTGNTGGNTGDSGQTGGNTGGDSGNTGTEGGNKDPEPDTPTTPDNPPVNPPVSPDTPVTGGDTTTE